jgi:type IV secretion system protein VirB1
MMLPLDFLVLAQQCAPQVSPFTMAAIVRTESGFNPYAIGVVRGRLLREPSNVAEAVSTAHALAAEGWNFSAGLTQVSRANWSAYGLTERSVFEPCRNLAVGAAILQRCFEAARRAQTDTGFGPQVALRASLSCYASGNFSTGYRTGYVTRVVDSAGDQSVPPSPVVVPSIAPIPIDPEVYENPARAQPTSHPVSEPAGTSPGTRGSEAENSAVVF